MLKNPKFCVKNFVLKRSKNFLLKKMILKRSKQNVLNNPKFYVKQFYVLTNFALKTIPRHFATKSFVLKMILNKPYRRE